MTRLACNHCKVLNFEPLEWLNACVKQAVKDSRPFDFDKFPEMLLVSEMHNN